MQIFMEPAKNQGGGQINLSFILTIVVILVVLFLFRQMSRKAAAKQEESRKEWFVVGTNVVTTSGFFGTIVDIDGDAVTLESPSGDETVWLRAAISQPMEIPLASVGEEDVSAGHTDAETPQEDVSDTDTTDTDKTTQA